MAPEQLRSAMAVDAQADIWSLGVILYELLSGESPFGEGSLAELHVAVLDGAVEPIAQLRQDVPPEVANVVERCMQKEVELRYPTVGALARDLEPFASGDVSGLIAGIERWENRSHREEQTTQAGQVATTRAATTQDAPSNTRTTWGGEAGRQGSRAWSLGLFGAAAVVALIAGLWLTREEPTVEPATDAVEPATDATATSTATNSAAVVSASADTASFLTTTTATGSTATPSVAANTTSAQSKVAPGAAANTASAAANTASAAAKTTVPAPATRPPATESARDPMEIRKWK